MTSVITDIFFDRGQSWPIRIQFILFFFSIESYISLPAREEDIKLQILS